MFKSGCKNRSFCFKLCLVSGFFRLSFLFSFRWFSKELFVSHFIVRGLRNERTPPPKCIYFHAFWGKNSEIIGSAPLWGCLLGNHGPAITLDVKQLDSPLQRFFVTLFLSLQLHSQILHSLSLTLFFCLLYFPQWRNLSTNTRTKKSTTIGLTARKPEIISSTTAPLTEICLHSTTLVWVKWKQIHFLFTKPKKTIKTPTTTENDYRVRAEFGQCFRIPGFGRKRTSGTWLIL